MKKTTRRNFLKTASAGVFWIPATQLFGQALPPLSKQVRMAVIGAGGIGHPFRKSLQAAGATVVALCDVDAAALNDERIDMKSSVPCFRDYREMFDKMGREFDVVSINTPDHTHAWLALETILRGKHLMLQKPLARTFEECDLIAAAAKKKGVVFQLGNQGHPGCKRYIPLRDGGVWGDILRVDAWTGKTTTRRLFKERTGRRRPTAFPKPMPWDDRQNADSWNLWCGPAPDHGYSTLFAPFIWRVWTDYAGGAVCDMGIHNMDPLFTTMKIGMPYSIRSQCSEGADFAHADGTKTTMKFRPSKWLPKGVEVTWWDGEIYPEVPLRADPEIVFGCGQKGSDDGLVIHGTRYTTWGDSHAAPPRIIAEYGKDWGPSAKAARAKWSKIAEDVRVPNHFEQFVAACRAGDPRMCESDADYSAKFTQVLNLCALATHFPNTELLFDEKTKRITNNADADKLLRVTCRPGWDLHALAASI